MPSWPNTLPAHFLQQGFDETAPSAAIRTKLKDAPLPVVRQRQTSAARPIKGIIRTSVDYSFNGIDTLDQFFLTTCKGGALSFTWTSPRPPYSSGTFRWLKAPVYSCLGGTTWEAEIDVEMLP